MYDYGVFEGLDFVDLIEMDDEAYQFYILGVWKDSEGGYYMGTDSGCSCPSYWENFTREDLTGPLTFEQMSEEATSLWNDAPRSGEGSGPIEEFLAGLNN